MSIIHHLSDEILITYASGNLSEGWCIGVATHLALCPQCRVRLAHFECLGGNLLESLPQEEVLDTSWNAVVARLTTCEAHTEAPKHENSEIKPILPQPLRSYAGNDVHDLKWRSLGRGAYHIILPTGDNTVTVRLLKIPAGKPVPEHGHGGRELTLVLSGSFVDGDQTFARGDIEEADTDMIHQPVATPDQDCICLTITDAPLRFSNWAVRLVQPILGI